MLGLGTPTRMASAEFGADTPVAVLDEETTADRISRSLPASDGVRRGRLRRYRR
ncbi:hypothetical protein ACIBO9_14870 [Streptomyces prunicolor]|uniref:hypothetical protein n=1 Tax=Streptomyces prunicolor TaxID=67348 RepID=UPI0037CD7ED1